MTHSEKVVKAILGYRSETGNKLLPDVAKRKMTSWDGNSFLLGVMFDRGIIFERAWEAGKIVNYVFGELSDPSRLWKGILGLEKKRLLMFMKFGNGGKAFHRFYKEFADKLPLAAKFILEKYDGDPRKIWNNQKDVGKVEERLKEIPLIGMALASMAVRHLAEYYGLLGGRAAFKQIGIKPDIHVMRVFKRTGLVKRELDYKEAMAVAKELFPKYPGSLDAPAWEIGKNFCRPRTPKCSDCPIKAACKRLISQG